jgi:hypothetical protein
LTLPNPLILTKAITQTMRCDNQLFERRQERHSTQGLYKVEAITPWKQAPTNGSKPEPMQIGSLSFKKLLQKEKDLRCKKDLCLYCGGENHQARDCPIKASTLKLRKVQNVSTSTQSKMEDVESENEDV